MSQKTIIVVPCYNEASRLKGDEFLSFVEQHEETEIVFANDGSKDNTLQVLDALCAQSPRLHYYDLQPNSGKAEAVRKAMLRVAKEMDADYIGFLDADLATPLNEVPPMASWMDKGYDIVMGLRLMRLGARVHRKSSRHYLGRCFATCASLMLKLPVYDTQCGAKLFRKEIVEQLFAETFTTRWLFDVELLARYCQFYPRERAIEKIYEYPLFQWEDVAGSRLKKSDFIKAPRELWQIKKRYHL